MIFSKILNIVWIFITRLRVNHWIHSQKFDKFSFPALAFVLFSVIGFSLWHWFPPSEFLLLFFLLLLFLCWNFFFRTKRLPVLYVYGAESIDTGNCHEKILEIIPDITCHIILFHDVVYQHSIGLFCYNIQCFCS